MVEKKPDITMPARRTALKRELAKVAQPARSRGCWPGGFTYKKQLMAYGKRTR